MEKLTGSGQWRDVKVQPNTEELAKDNGWFLIASAITKRRDVGKYLKGTFMGHALQFGDVTHWQPLPAPPVGGSGEVKELLDSAGIATVDPKQILTPEFDASRKERAGGSGAPEPYAPGIATEDIGTLELRGGAIFQCVDTVDHGLKWRRVISAEIIRGLIKAGSGDKPAEPCGVCGHVHQQGRITCSHVIRKDPREGVICCMCSVKQAERDSITKEVRGTVGLDQGDGSTRRSCNNENCSKDYQHEGLCDEEVPTESANAAGSSASGASSAEVGAGLASAVPSLITRLRCIGGKLRMNIKDASILDPDHWHVASVTQLIGEWDEVEKEAVLLEMSTSAASAPSPRCPKCGSEVTWWITSKVMMPVVRCRSEKCDAITRINDLSDFWQFFTASPEAGRAAEPCPFCGKPMQYVPDSIMGPWICRNESCGTTSQPSAAPAAYAQTGDVARNPSCQMCGKLMTRELCNDTVSCMTLYEWRCGSCGATTQPSAVPAESAEYWQLLRDAKKSIQPSAAKIGECGEALANGSKTAGAQDRTEHPSPVRCFTSGLGVQPSPLSNEHSPISSCASHRSGPVVGCSECNHAASSPIAPSEAERIAEIRAREQKATPGPWYADGLDRHTEEEGWIFDIVTRKDGKFDDFVARVPSDIDSNKTEDHPRAIADHSFIAHARADIPWLLSRITDLRQQLRDSHAGHCNHPDQVVNGPGCSCRYVPGFELRLANERITELERHKENYDKTFLQRACWRLRDLLLWSRRHTRYPFVPNLSRRNSGSRERGPTGSYGGGKRGYCQNLVTNAKRTAANWFRREVIASQTRGGAAPQDLGEAQK